MNSFIAEVGRLGAGRLAMLLAAGLAATLMVAALALGAGAEPMVLLYGDLDVRDAAAIAQSLDRAGVRYELAGDGSAILAPRDEAAAARLMLAGKGLPPSTGSAGYARAAVEQTLRDRVRSIVEGVVGPGAARVQVSVDLDERQVTTQEEAYDPDGQVIRSEETARPGSAGAAGSTTSYEISKTVTTATQPPGEIRRISVAVAVDGVRTPGRDGGAPGWSPRSPDDMQRIDQLVKAAVGYSAQRGDQVQVENVRFSDPEVANGGALGGRLGLRTIGIAVMAAAGLMLLAVLGISLARSGFPPRSAADAAPVPPAAPPAIDGPAARLALAPPRRPASRSLLDAEAADPGSVLGRAAAVATNAPEASARVLRSWLRETA